MPTVTHKKMLCRKRRRRKLHKLRQRLAEARNMAERERLITRILKISRRATIPGA